MIPKHDLFVIFVTCFQLGMQPTARELGVANESWGEVVDIRAESWGWPVDSWAESWGETVDSGRE